MRQNNISMNYMTDYIYPIKRLSEIDTEECVRGYRAGMGWSHVDYCSKSSSYWHGYRNGRVDSGAEPLSPEQRALTKQYLARRSH